MSSSLLAAASGLKPGDAPVNVQLDKHLWFIAEAGAAAARPIRIAAREWAESHGVKFTPLEASMVKGRAGGSLRVLGPTGAKGIYTGAHREMTSVITLGSVRVPLDPTDRPTRRNSLLVSDYLANKAHNRVVSRSEEAQAALEEAGEWMSGTHCDGADDPRCLPRMMFPSACPTHLPQHEQRQDFRKQHRVRGSSTWVDGEGRIWDHAGPPHTLDAVHVGGVCLPLGMHWDVNSSRRFEVANGWEKWVVRREGYINVHPDGYLRGQRAVRAPLGRGGPGGKQKR